MEGSKISELLNPVNGAKISALLFQAVGHKGRRRELDFTAEVNVYAIYEVEKKFYYLPTPYKPGFGGIENKLPYPKIENVRFDEYRSMNIRHTEGEFCFSFFYENDINDFLGDGATKHDLFLTGGLISNNGDAFTLALKRIGSEDRHLSSVDGAPCPPYWKYGAPTQGKKVKAVKLLIREDWQIDALKELFVELCPE